MSFQKAMVLFFTKKHYEHLLCANFSVAIIS